MLSLPEAGPLMLGKPHHGDRAFDLIWPASFGSARQAQLDVCTGRLLTEPFRSDEGVENFVEQPAYRYGLLDEGNMHWLDFRPAEPPEPLRPATLRFRARLTLFARELAARGVHYEDDENGLYYELADAIEDAAVPTGFLEPNASLVRSVSSYDDHSDKFDRALAMYDPEEDLEIDRRRTGYRALSSELDVTETRLISSPRTVGNDRVDETWLDDVIGRAATAAGLRMSADAVWLSAAELAGASALEKDASSIVWNAVDAADRLQRALFLLAADQPMIEERLAAARDAIVATILCARDTHIGAPIQRQPPPFPRGVPAIARLVGTSRTEALPPTALIDAAAAMSEPIERRLAVFWALRFDVSPDAIAAALGSWEDVTDYSAICDG